MPFLQILMDALYIIGTPLYPGIEAQQHAVAPQWYFLRLSLYTGTDFNPKLLLFLSIDKDLDCEDVDWIIEQVCRLPILII